MKAKVAKIKAHGVTCFVNRQLIYNYPESLFAEAGIMCIEHADFEGVERLALVSGGEIASTFDQPSLVKLGKCDTIEEIMIGEDKVRSFFDEADWGPALISVCYSSSNFQESRRVRPARSYYAEPHHKWWKRQIGPCTMRFRSCPRQSRRREQSWVGAVPR